jgi:hypothetical protein
MAKAMGAALALLLAAAPAMAANNKRVQEKRAQERAARKACLSGDFAKGVDILSALFVDTKEPTYIFNQGRCFEQNRRWEDAIARFREFLNTEGKLDEADVAAAEKHIANCREMLAQERPAGATQSPPALQPPPETAPTPAIEPNPGPSSTAEPTLAQSETKPPASGAGSGLRTGGIVVAAVGVAALVAGVDLSLKVNNMVDQMETTPDGYSSSKSSSRDTYAALAWTSYGVGAACVVTGAILFGFGLKAKAGASKTVALVPALGTDSVGAALVGAF